MRASNTQLDLGNDRFSHRQIASTVSSKFQQLIILPTEKCNFRCTYCYEDFLIGRMKEEVQLSLEKFMSRRIPELTALSMEWFGGEPLVARKVVLRLARHASRVCGEFGVALTGGMTTNAYLLSPELFEELISCDQRFFQITFDGWGEGHDVVRRQANGKGSFERIWENVVATKRETADFGITLRIHVRRDNHRSLETLLENIATAFGRDKRYQLDFEHLRNLGGEGGKSVDRPMSLEELREVEVGFRAHYEAALAKYHPVSSTEALVESPPRQAARIGEVKASEGSGATPYICYAAKPNSLLIRADGRIGKCTVALNDDRNTIGHIRPDGTINIDNELLRPWIRGLADLDEKALTCPLVGLASGARATSAASPR